MVTGPWIKSVLIFHKGVGVHSDPLSNFGPASYEES